ncbi:glycosyltransferase family 4 protein [Gracilibacillus timonensis]|uniref:glycosyltransferase family 4 protein n=1 Tax=Gracilibacillus timonensis TaxID=1816696 RepID=UPI000824B9BB|nr:glycosyltransferase family 4 protein [Gracilibacillus timonensis]
MNVLFIATYSGISGASHSLISMVKYLKTYQINAIVILPGDGPLENILIEENIPYKKLKIYPWVIKIEKSTLIKEKIKWRIKQLINIFQEIRISSVIKNNNIDIVHINAITASSGYIAAKKNETKIIWHIREILEQGLGKKFWDENKAYKCLNSSNRVIAISDSVKNKYSNVISDDLFMRVYNGIDTNEYSMKPNFIFEENKITLTLAGRIVASKGHEEVIYAVKFLIEKGYKDIVVQFVGGDGEKSFATYIKKLVQDFGLENQIIFLGHKSNMQDIWNETDIAIVSSKAEAFGRVTVEAMMSGVLVIGANTEGTEELIADKYGLTYEQGNYLSLANQIDYALNHKKEMKETALISQKHAHESFTAEINAKEIYGIYKKLLN